MKKRSPNSHASHTKEFLICFNKHGEKEEERERKRRGRKRRKKKTNSNSYAIHSIAQAMTEDTKIDTFVKHGAEKRIKRQWQTLG